MNLLIEPIGGASGNMVLGACLDLGLDRPAWLSRLRELPICPWILEEARVQKRGVDAQHIDFALSPGPRTWSAAELSLVAAPFPRAARCLQALFEAEARARGKRIDELSWPDLAGADLLLDTIGFVTALDLLDVQQVYCTPLPLGQGLCRHHGQPVANPNPAVAWLLQNVPVFRVPLHEETVTTTGAALLSRLADFTLPSPYRVRSLGYGAGTSDFPMSNVVRLSLIE